MTDRNEKGQFTEGNSGNPSGRPPLYRDQDAILFEEKVEQYFDGCKAEDRTPTLAGLALSLGFVSRQTLKEYEDTRPLFSDTVKRARLRIEADRSERLVEREKYTPGIAMDLASNHGWITDRGERTGANGQPLNPPTLDVSKLSDDALRELREAQRK